MRSPALLALVVLVCACACAGEPAGPDEAATTGPAGGCFGCECGPELPCGMGLECTDAVCSLIDETGGDTPPSVCGWNFGESWYDCGFRGEDPGGEHPRACPGGLTVGVACPDALPFEGCCDAEGDVWYCKDGVVVRTGC